MSKMTARYKKGEFGRTHIFTVLCILYANVLDVHISLKLKTTLGVTIILIMYMPQPAILISLVRLICVVRGGCDGLWL